MASTNSDQHPGTLSAVQDLTAFGFTSELFSTASTSSSPSSSPSSSSIPCTDDLMSSQFTPYSHQGDPSEGNALDMELFGQSELAFNLEESPLNGPSGPCSPTSDAFQATESGPMMPDGPVMDHSKLSAENSGPRSSVVRPVPKPLNLALSTPQTMDPALDSSNIPSASMSMALSDSPSPTRSNSPFSSSMPSSPTSPPPSYDDILVPVVACANCKRSHIKCDHGRPCQNCLKHPSKAATCRDAVPKPRGRPKGGSKAAAAADAMYGGVRLQQHPGFQSFTGGSSLLHMDQQGYPHQLNRQRAMSLSHGPSAFPVMSQQQHELLMRQPERVQYHQRTVSHGHVPMHGPGVEYHHPGLAAWGAGAPGVPEMVAEMQAGPGHPMAVDGLQGPLGYTNPSLDAYELQQLEKHRQQIQKLQQLENAQAAVAVATAVAKAANPHDVGMTRSMSDHHHYGGPRPQLRQFHSEQHQQLLQQRHRQHPGANLTLMIPSTSISAGPSPVSGSFPVSPAGYPASPASLLPSQPHSPAMSIHSPTQGYSHHGHHGHSLLSSMPHGPVAPDANGSMARLLQQEMEIKHDLEIFEKQKQLELARINLQKLQLQQHHVRGPMMPSTPTAVAQEQQNSLERFKQLQSQYYQQHLVKHDQQQQQQQQARMRYAAGRRQSLQYAPTAGLSLSGPLPPVHDEEMIGIDG
ncbi:hypothetical protein B0O80DRAFT_494739 [Mortierella sp. GBAus27b]|nr:hypothetical protein BGX31_004965 [Mortierella sp. GBA43]KAI8360584.1 hypothetical protein B0O80DRAFT_494739 [Mortierella sp. GBAus27b]